MKKIKECITYVYGLVTQLKGCCSIKKNSDNKVYGYTFRNLDWNSFDLSKVNKLLANTGWQCTFGEGLDINPITTATNKFNAPLETSYVYIGKDMRKDVALDSLINVDIDA